MAKDPTTRRRRGLHLLNDRLLALKNLVRVRNEEITTEFSREYTSEEEEEEAETTAEELSDLADGDIVPGATEAGPRNEDPNQDNDEEDGAKDDAEDDGSSNGADKQSSQIMADTRQGRSGPESSSQPGDSGIRDSELTGEAPLMDMDDLPVLTESISTGVIPVPIPGDSPAVETQRTENLPNAPTRRDLESAASAILDLIEEQISYANLPGPTSADREALKRAIADYLTA